MRLGILGGTFDPIHYGHLQLAETCRDELCLDEIRLMPAGNPPHKSERTITDGHARADMAELAVSGYPEYTVNRRELRREGPSFTVETLQELHDEIPDATLFFLMGADSLADLATWREPERIAELATIVAVNRPGHPLPDVDRLEEWLGSVVGPRIRLVSHSGNDLSASELRNRIREDRSIRFLTPRAVEAYLHEHKLYPDDSTAAGR